MGRSGTRSWQRRRRVLLVAWVTLAITAVGLAGLTGLTCRYGLHRQYATFSGGRGYVVSVMAGRVLVSYDPSVVVGYGWTGALDRWYWPDVVPRIRWGSAAWMVSVPFWLPALAAGGGAWWFRRRWRRVRVAGVCVRCGYEVGEMRVCPECGAEVVG
jgi:hypothetical protein